MSVFLAILWYFSEHISWIAPLIVLLTTIKFWIFIKCKVVLENNFTYVAAFDAAAITYTLTQLKHYKRFFKTCTYIFTGVSIKSPLDGCFTEAHLGSSIKYVRKIFRKTNISKPPDTHTYVKMLVFRKILRTYLMDGPFRSAFRCYFFAKRFILNVQQGPE